MSRARPNYDAQRREKFTKQTVAVIDNALRSMERFPDRKADIIGRAYHQGTTDGAQWETTHRKGFICPRCGQWMEIYYTAHTRNKLRYCPLCGCSFDEYPIEG